MALHSNKHYTRLLKDLYRAFPDSSRKREESIERWAIILDNYSSSRAEDRGKSIEYRDIDIYPLLGRKLRIPERQKLENGPRLRTPNETER